MKRKLVTVDAETLLATPMSKTMFIVDGLIPQGVNVLSGAAKIGKSWLMLWLGLQVSQREHILPSEKAFAYKMKRDALNHQGITSPQVGEKLLTVEKIGADNGDSKNQVLRYIRLTHLIPELLSMVDENKIAFNPAVEISYLEQAEQRTLLDAMEQNDCTPSHAQAIRLKKLSQEGVLQDQTIYDILAEQKPNQQEQYKFKREDIRKYFPKNYTDKQICDIVIKLLEQWQRRRERDRDSR